MSRITATSDSQRNEWWSEFKMDLVTGSAAGVAIAYSTFPAEALKKRWETNQTTHFKYYRGSLLFAANIVPTTAIQWTTDGVVRQYLPENAHWLQQLAASAFCGVTGAITATPVENSVVRQQVLEVGAVPVIKDMLQQGMLRPWKTYPLIATRDGIFTMFMMSILPALDAYTKTNNYSEWSQWGANAMGSSVGAALSHPFDAVASNIQMTHQRIRAADMAKMMYSRGGVAEFYKGIFPRLFLFFAFSNGIPQFKKAADHWIYGRAELPNIFKRITGSKTASTEPDIGHQMKVTKP